MTTATDAVRLRPLDGRDLPRLARLEAELFGPGAWSEAMLAEELEGPGRWYVGAEVVDSALVEAGLVDADLVGYAGLWFDGDDVQVMTIGVDSRYQGRRIGHRLMEALLDRARELGARTVLLEVRVDNEAALALYERFGFERLALRKRYYQPEDMDAWTMRLRLPTDEERSVVLIEPDELRGMLSRGEDVTVLDVRWALGRSDGREQHEAGHVPGAVYVDLDTELAAPATPQDGRHPLPDVADLQVSARRWGVRTGVPVVVYDAVGGMSAARAWWLLRWGGADDVRLLDGGLGAWLADGGALETGDVVPEPGDVVLVAGSMPTVDADETAALAGTDVVLDARAAERYRGDVEPVDPRAGHVPGALSAPTAENLDADGRFRSAGELLDRFGSLGAAAGTERRVVVYCGSGVTAAHEVAALASIGVEAALYPGSWSQWSADQSRGVALGDEPGGASDGA